MQETAQTRDDSAKRIRSPAETLQIESDEAHARALQRQDARSFRREEEARELRLAQGIHFDSPKAPPMPARGSSSSSSGFSGPRGIGVASTSSPSPPQVTKPPTPAQPEISKDPTRRPSLSFLYRIDSTDLQNRTRCEKNEDMER